MPTVRLTDEGISHVLLDLDDTLLTTRQAMIEAIALVCAQLWPSAPPHTWHAFAVRYNTDPHGWFRLYTSGAITIEENRYRRFEDARLHHGLGQAPFEHFTSGYDQGFLTAISLYDDARRLLDRLAGAGIPVALLTNASTMLTHEKLTRLNLHARFDAIVTRDTLGFGKPDPRAFQRACADLGGEPRRTLYVGDELDVDPLAATAAGLYGVWLDRRDTWDGADVGVPVVRSLDDLGL